MNVLQPHSYEARGRVFESTRAYHLTRLESVSLALSASPRMVETYQGRRDFVGLYLKPPALPWSPLVDAKSRIPPLDRAQPEYEVHA